jgi:hypothetical protein
MTPETYICLICCCALRGPWQVCGNRCYERLVAV